MPECDGVEAAMKITKFLNKRLPKAQHSALCCITAYAGKKYEENAKQANIEFFL